LKGLAKEGILFMCFYELHTEGIDYTAGKAS